MSNRLTIENYEKISQWTYATPHWYAPLAYDTPKEHVGFVLGFVENNTAYSVKFHFSDVKPWDKRKSLLINRTISEDGMVSIYLDEDGLAVNKWEHPAKNLTLPYVLECIYQYIIAPHEKAIGQTKGSV